MDCTTPPASLVPRRPAFLPSVCVHDTSTLQMSSAPVYYCEHKWKVKMGEAWERGYILAVFVEVKLHL